MDSIEFEPRDWIVLNEVRANNSLIYSRFNALREVPEPDLNGDIKVMPFQGSYTLGSSPNGGFIRVDVTGAGSSLLARRMIQVEHGSRFFDLLSLEDNFISFSASSS